MPYLKIVTNKPLPADGNTALLKKISSKLSQLLGKPERYVMLEIVGSSVLLFGSSDAPAAYVELKNIGLDVVYLGLLSRDICELLHTELGIAPDRIYIEFTNINGSFWGWNASTF